MQESVSKHVDSRVFLVLLAGRSTALAPSLHLQMLPLAWGCLDTAHLSGDWQCWSGECVTVALGNCQQLKSFPRQAGWTMWGEPLTALGYPGCRVGTSGAGPEALYSTTVQKGLRTPWCLYPGPSTLRKVQEHAMSPWCMVPTAQPLWIPACLLADTTQGALGLSFTLSFTRHLSLCFPAPGASEAGLKEDLLQHWNALQSLPPSLEIFGVRGHKSQ